MPDADKPVDRLNRVTNRILAHYDANARDLPWRSRPGAPLPDPYHVWLSEIMLQQTTVAAVRPYFEQFLGLWPDVTALAAAADADVMKEWAGLGYYARARNLLACARRVVSAYGGTFPANETALRTLPGIGPYTAAAISSIAFGQYAVVVDGNVERVIARLFALETPMPAAKPEIATHMAALTPDGRAGDFAQAIMDMGATICTPRNPACERCPVAHDCSGRQDWARFPIKQPKAVRPLRRGSVWWIERDGAVLLVTRPAKGLLGGMQALPTCDWKGSSHPPFAAEWQSAGSITHIFTHFELKLEVKRAVIVHDSTLTLAGHWHPIDQLDQAGLPSVFAKAAHRAMNWENMDVA